MINNHLDSSYIQTLSEIKAAVKTARIKASLSVNKEMLILYWQIGKIVLGRQEKEGWGAKIINRLSVDLQNEFSDMKPKAGFSATNIKYMRHFASAYPNLIEISHQPGDQLVVVAKDSPFLSIPWRHNTALLS